MTINTAIRRVIKKVPGIIISTLIWGVFWGIPLYIIQMISANYLPYRAGFALVVFSRVIIGAFILSYIYRLSVHAIVDRDIGLFNSFGLGTAFKFTVVYFVIWAINDISGPYISYIMSDFLMYPLGFLVFFISDLLRTSVIPYALGDKLGSGLLGGLRLYANNFAFIIISLLVLFLARLIPYAGVYLFVILFMMYELIKVVLYIEDNDINHTYSEAIYGAYSPNFN